MIKYKIFRKGTLIKKSKGFHKISYFDQLSGITNLRDKSNWILSQNLQKYIKTTYNLTLADYKALCEFGNMDKKFKCKCCNRTKSYKHFFYRIGVDWKENCKHCCDNKIEKNTSK